MTVSDSQSEITGTFLNKYLQILSPTVNNTTMYINYKKITRSHLSFTYHQRRAADTSGRVRDYICVPLKILTGFITLRNAVKINFARLILKAHVYNVQMFERVNRIVM